MVVNFVPVIINKYEDFNFHTESDCWLVTTIWIDLYLQLSIEEKGRVIKLKEKTVGIVY